MALYPQDSDDEDDQKQELDEDGIPIPKKSKKDKNSKLQAGREANIDVQNLFSNDPSKCKFHNPVDKIDLINNLNQIKLLQISEHFEIIPGQEVDLD